MKSMFLFFSHKLTKEQIEDAKNILGIENFIYLPKDIQVIWSNINPLKNNDVYIKKIKEYIDENINQNDIVLVQGEYGFSFKIVVYLKEKMIKSVYSSTKRISTEKLSDNGEITKESYFKHIKFLEY